MSASEGNRNIIEVMSKRVTDQYVDLPRFLARFSYPVSLNLSEHIGRAVYQKGFADGLEFLCLMANKFYTWIVNAQEPQHILESFVVEENKQIEWKTRDLISTVKKWETGQASNTELAKAITRFCRMTYGVRFPMVSFFLRMILPDRFGVLDVHCVSALQSLGFKVKDIPTEESDKDAYFEQYDGLDYMEYNELITEVGRCYSLPSKSGGQRCMTPSEVDMALYEYDKSAGILETDLAPKQRLSVEDKVRGITDIVEEIVEGTKTGPDWVRRAGYRFSARMRRFAGKNDLDSMFRYYSNLAAGRVGKGVGDWLSERGLPSVESEMEKVRRIYEDR